MSEVPFTPNLEYYKTMTAVEYIKYASTFYHSFDNVRIVSCTNKNGSCYISGYFMDYNNNNRVNKFDTIITKHRKNTKEDDEGEFTYVYNNAFYLINNTIDDYYNTSGSLISASYTINSAARMSGIPEHVIKVALVGITIEI